MDEGMQGTPQLLCMNTIQAMIFDMDGVIVDSEPLHCQIEHRILKQYGIEAPWSEWDQFTGVPEHAVFQYIVDHFTDGEYSVVELIRAKYQLFMSMLDEQLQPIAGALDFIRWTRERYGKVALTTSSGKEVQQKVFDLFYLHPYFDVVITQEHIQNGKPHPEPYLKTVEALQLPAQHCMVLEDSVNGIKSAKEAGCYVMGITTSFAEDILRNAGADCVVDRFSALYDHLVG